MFMLRKSRNVVQVSNRKRLKMERFYGGGIQTSLLENDLTIEAIIARKLGRRSQEYPLVLFFTFLQ